MKTIWEKLYRKHLKNRIADLAETQRDLKEQIKELKLKKEELDFRPENCRYCKYRTQYEKEMAYLQNSRFENKKDLTYYHQQLNKLSGKQNSHEAKYYFGYITAAYMSFETYILYFRTNEFFIEKTYGITENEFLCGSRSNPKKINFDEVIKYGEEESLLISLKEEIEFKYADLTEKHDSAEQEIFKLNKKINDKTSKFEKKIEQKRKAFEEKIKEERAKFNETLKKEKDIRQSFVDIRITASLDKGKKMKELFEEYKNA